MTKYLLKLYISGKTLKSEEAISNLKKLCEKELGDQYKLEIINVYEEPGKAEDDKIMATPTLIKKLPLPLRRIIGDLSQREKILRGLEIRQKKG